MLAHELREKRRADILQALTQQRDIRLLPFAGRQFQFQNHRHDDAPDVFDDRGAGFAFLLFHPVQHISQRDIGLLNHPVLVAKKLMRIAKIAHHLHVRQIPADSFGDRLQQRVLLRQKRFAVGQWNALAIQYLHRPDRLAVNTNVLGNAPGAASGGSAAILPAMGHQAR